MISFDVRLNDRIFHKPGTDWIVTELRKASWQSYSCSLAGRQMPKMRCHSCRHLGFFLRFSLCHKGWRGSRRSSRAQILEIRIDHQCTHCRSCRSCRSCRLVVLWFLLRFLTLGIFTTETTKTKIVKIAMFAISFTACNTSTVEMYMTLRLTLLNRPRSNITMPIERPYGTSGVDNTNACHMC